MYHIHDKLTHSGYKQCKKIVLNFFLGISVTLVFDYPYPGFSHIRQY